MDFFRSRNWDLIGKSWLWFSISGLIILAGLVAWFGWGLHYGIDFTGGALVRYQFAHPIATTADEQATVVGNIRDALASLGLSDAEIQISGDNRLLIRTYAVANDAQAVAREQKIMAKLEALYGQNYGPITSLGRETVGPIVGADLRKSAIRAVVIGEALILIYIAIRYEFWFGLAAIIALAHDLLATTGLMALFRVELNSWYVAVVLTVVGYSVNDTVVIFDRIRENRSRHRHAPLAPIVNASLLETMTRSINTVMTVVFALLALFLFGGTVIHDFAFSMLVGICFGGYSSIFIAAPLVVKFDNWQKRRAGAPVSSRPVPASASAVASYGSLGARNGGGEEATAKSGGGARTSAAETMRRAAEVAQEEKRRARRARRAKKRAKQSQRKKS